MQRLLLISLQTAKMLTGPVGGQQPLENWNTARGRSGGRRRQPSTAIPMPRYAQIVVVTLALAVVISAGWGTYQWLRSESPKLAMAGAGVGGTPRVGVPQSGDWQSDATAALDASVRDAEAGNITEAEIDTDRAAGVLQMVRLHPVSATPDFFSGAVGQLDRVMHARPDSNRLAEHARLAEIALAELRSSMESPSRAARPSDTEAKHLVVRAPRTIAMNIELTPTLLGGNYLDATSMPDSAEILEPPSTRAFADNIGIGGLTFAGAAQTLDGIRWHDVVFIGTRLRYEGGQVSLQNVQFIHCTFGFTTDERGARLAKAIASGQNSLVIE